MCPALPRERCEVELRRRCQDLNEWPLVAALCISHLLSCLASLYHCLSLSFWHNFLFFSFNFSPLLSSHSLLLLLSPACLAQARSPLESSVPCLATRTLDDELGVQRSPSVGWLSKCWAGLWVGRLGARRGRGGGSSHQPAPNACCCVNSGEQCCSGCSFYPTVPSTALLHSVFLPSCIWDEAGRSGMLPLQGSSKMAAGTFFLSLEVSFVCKSG